MEKTTQFDLNEGIRQRRENLATSPAFRPDDLDELESHLRDSVTSLQTAGLSAREAFWVGRSRLGSSDLIEGEFGKMNTHWIWLDRGLWMAVGSVGIGLLSGLAQAWANFASFGVYGLASCYGLNLNWHLAGFLGLITDLFAVVGMILLVWRSGMNSHGWVRRLGSWLKSHPFLAALSVMLGSALNLGANSLVFLLVKTVPMSVYSHLANWRMSRILIPMLVWPMVIAWLLLRISRKPAAQ